MHTQSKYTKQKQNLKEIDENWWIQDFSITIEF